jgi:hypothetical protein
MNQLLSNAADNSRKMRTETRTTLVSGGVTGWDLFKREI